MNQKKLQSIWNEASFFPPMSTTTNQKEIQKNRIVSNQQLNSNFDIYNTTEATTKNDSSSMGDIQKKSDQSRQDQKNESTKLNEKYAQKKEDEHNNIPEYNKSEYQVYFEKNKHLRDGNFIPEHNNFAKQVKCPKLTKPKVDSYESISLITTDFIPEALGYIVGYNFSAQGSNNSSHILNRMGFTGGETDRVLGSNYFVKMNNPCSMTTSSEECKGKDAYFYVRNVPLKSPRGLLSTGLIEDIADLVPDELIRSFYGSGKFTTKCKSRNLPVGNSINDVSKQFVNRHVYLEQANLCTKHCEDNRSDSTKFTNCLKDCSRGFFLEKRCTPDTEIYKYDNIEYFETTSDSIFSVFTLFGLYYFTLFCIIFMAVFVIIIKTVFSI